MPTSNDSLGIVETKQVTLFDAGNPLTLVCAAAYTLLMAVLQ